jgi:tetratricopeptide (TPR) repeat protein
MICQVCNAHNPDDDEFCSRCGHKLLVVSGALSAEVEPEEVDDEEAFSLDEHLLERISVLEEAVKRTAETVRGLLTAVRKQEQTSLVNQTGLAALRELLERKGLLDVDEWADLWESKMDFQLLALEKRERFAQVRERIGSLYRGDRRGDFLERLEEAEHAFAGFDVERAMAALEEAHELDRSNYELAFFLAETWFNEGEGETALGYFHRVLEARPEHFEALVYGGVLMHEIGRSDAAEELLRRAVELYPDHFLPAFSLGAVYAATGDLVRAATFLERAVDFEPVPQAQFLLGNCLYEMGKLTPAIAHLRDAVHADPGFEEAWYVLGLAYLDRSWNRKALDAFRRAQRLNPRKLRYQDLVRYLSSDDAAPLPPVEGEAGEWYARAEEHRRADEPRKAANCYRRALALDADNPTLLLSAALVYLQLDRVADIESLARRVLDLAPGEMLEATAYAALAEALRSQGRLREGNRLGKKLLAGGKSAYTRTIAHYEMACNLAEMEEDLDGALDHARRALELAPEELKSFPVAALGWVHYKRQEYAKAVDHLARASELVPSATNLTHLGMALLASGEEERARSVLAEARSLEEGGGGLEERMLQCLKDSARVMERARRKKK